MSRIPPLEPPYSPEVEEQLLRMMPEGVEPIALFRTFVRNLPMAQAMTTWGTYALSRRLSLSLRDREILIDRTCVRCGCEYEFGVHAAYFADAAALSADQLASLAVGVGEDDCWTEERDRVLIRLADALHEHATIPDELGDDLAGHLDDAELLEATLLCGWYHAISFAANVAQAPPEPWAPRIPGFGGLGIQMTASERADTVIG